MVRPGVLAKSNALRITTTFCALAHYAGSFPGFVSPDSLAMYNQALEGSYTTAHTPYLSWIWSLMLPKWTGPVGPHAAQLALFWGGIYLICFGLQKKIGPKIALIPVLLFLTDSVWVMSWLWKDVASAAFLVLSVGLLLRAEYCNEDLATKVVRCAGSVALALFLMARMYMLPANLFVILFFLLFIAESVNGPSLTILGILRATRVPLIALITSCLILQLFTHTVIKPVRYTANGSAIFIQDLMRIQCLTTSHEQLIPEKFVLTGEGKLCDRFSPSGLESLVYYADGYTHLRLAESIEEETELQVIWKQNLLKNISPLLSSRLVLFLNFFDKSNWVPYSESSLQYWPEGSRSISSEMGWRPLGGIALLSARLPAMLVSIFPLLRSFLTLGVIPGILIPWLIIGVLYFRNQKVRLSLLVGSLFPVMWSLQFALISAWNDAARYFIPGSWFGWCISLLLLRELNSENPENKLGI
jgi:hypothetical protein